MFELNPAVQEHISESLIADRWQARQVARSTQAGSKWVLVGPKLRGRLVMNSNLLDSSVLLSTSDVSRPGLLVQRWQLVAHHASADMVLAMARTAETAPDSEPVAWSRAKLNRRLRGIGWHRTTGLLRAVLGPETTWENPDGAYRLTVVSPGPERAEAASLTGPGVLVAIGPTTPVAVVVGLVDAVANRTVCRGGVSI